VVDLDEFAELGFVRLRGAVPPEVVRTVRAAAEAAVPADGSPWAIELLSVYDVPALLEALSPAVRGAFDAVLGAGEWWLNSMWGFPTRFSGALDEVWHVDGDWFHHHIDSTEQVLTPVVLWQDVGEDDGPTLFAPGSHRQVAALLEAREPDGIPGGEIVAVVGAVIDGTGAVPATGEAGDVYVCHALLAHSLHPRGPKESRRVISNVCVHGKRRRRLDELPYRSS